MLTLRVTDYAAHSAIAPHFHEEPSLIVVVHGAYLERIRGAEVEHRAGRMIWYPAGAMHSQRFGATGARKIVFTPPPATMDYLRERGVPLGDARHVDARATSQLAHRVLAEVANVDTFTPLAVEGLALELVARFARAERPAAHPAPPAWVRAARDLVRERATEPLSLNEIAVHVGRHPVHLAREFRRHYGLSVGAYRRQVCLQRAEQMLGRDVGLSEIAVECGFASHSHFCRAFKSAYGVTPSSFRGPR